MNLKVFVFVMLPVLIALSCIFVRVQENEKLLLPDQKIQSWQIEAHVRVLGRGRTAKVELELPLLSASYDLQSENFISGGMAVGILNTEGSRRAVWSGYVADGEEQDFYYRAQVRLRTNEWQAPKPKGEYPANLSEQDEKYTKIIVKRLSAEGLTGHDLIEDIAKEVLKGNSAEALALRKGEKKAFEQAELVNNVIRYAGYPARLVQGLKLVGPERTARFHPWVEAYVDGVWYPIDVRNARTRMGSRYFGWNRGDTTLATVRGAAEDRTAVSVLPLEFGALNGRSDKKESKLFSFSEFSVEAQALFRIILVVPVGALFVAFLRCIIGIKTIGTFMPVLIALSFRETELLWGLTTYLAVILVSLLARYFLEHLQLLVVPRLAATLTLVVMVILSFTIVGNYFDIRQGLSVALFPIVILTMMVERISIMFEELGVVTALKQTLVTLGVAATVYLVITYDYVQYYMFVFPELLLIVLAGAILIGRFTGYRLVELYRFRTFLKGA